MPEIELIPDSACQYNASDPYYVDFDNRPLQAIIARQKMINSMVDADHNVLVSAKGSTSDLATRLNSSLTDAGHLIPDSIDLAMHSIASHTDSLDQTTFLDAVEVITSVPNEFVRMTVYERDKLSLVADEATSIKLNFESAGPSLTPVEIDNGTAIFANSVGTSWRWDGGKFYIDLNFPIASAHSHFYDVEPSNPSVNYTTYYTPYAFTEGSLRVYINGSRVSADESYHPGATPISEWVLNKISSVDASTGEFVLMTAITAADLITVDFDRPYLVVT